MDPKDAVADWVNAWDDWDTDIGALILFVSRHPLGMPTVTATVIPSPDGADPAAHVAYHTALALADNDLRPHQLMAAAYAINAHVTVTEGPPDAALLADGRHGRIYTRPDAQEGLHVIYRACTLGATTTSWTRIRRTGQVIDIPNNQTITTNAPFDEILRGFADAAAKITVRLSN